MSPSNGGALGKGFLCFQPLRKNARDWCYTHGEFPPATTTRRIIVKFNLSWNSSSSSCFWSERENAMPAFVGILVKSGVQTHTHVSFPLLWKKSNGKQKNPLFERSPILPPLQDGTTLAPAMAPMKKKWRLHFQCHGETRFFWCAYLKKIEKKTFILKTIWNISNFLREKEVKTFEMLGSIRICKNPDSVKERKEVEEKRKEDWHCSWVVGPTRVE